MGQPATAAVVVHLQGAVLATRACVGSTHQALHVSPSIIACVPINQTLQNVSPSQVSDYLVAQNELDKLAGVALKRIQHFYYKTGGWRGGWIGGRVGVARAKQ